MSKRTLQTFVSEAVDAQTGEIITYESKKVISEKIDSESFYMTFTDYIAPIFKLKSEIALKILIWMCENAQFNTGIILFSSDERNRLCTELSISTTQLSHSLKKLKDLKLISGKSNIRINPLIFWKGDAQSRKDLLKDKMLQISFELVPRD